MPRKPRTYLPGLPAHLVQRGNDRQACFLSDDDHRFYLSCLCSAAQRCGVAVHAYVLMTNHVHLLVTPDSRDGIAAMMQSIGRRYVRYFNDTNGRTGTLWEGRHRGSVIEAESYLISCLRYVENNPVRARMVADPADYDWSSYRVNAGLAGDAWLTPHPVYLELGADGTTRAAQYRALFDDPATSSRDRAIREALQFGTPLGGADFARMVEARTHQRPGRTVRGRPRRWLNRRPK